MARGPQKADELSVLTVNTGAVTFRVLGTSPLVMNRMSEKAKRQLLLPPQKKNAAERATTLKHEPLEEFRGAAYRTLTPGPTRLILPGGSFKRAISDVAVDLPGAFKAQVARLTDVEQFNVSVYGIPYVHGSIVRMADARKTPDVRFRAILPRWACELTVTYVQPLLNAGTVANLFAAAGVIMGVGDFRPQKGGSFGKFELVGDDNEEWDEIVQTMGIEMQDDAMREPMFYDDDTEELVQWFDAEVAKRREAPATPVKRGRKAAQPEPEVTA